MADITGWGRGAWAEGPWGTSIPVELTGVSATGSVNSVTISTQALVLPTGVEGTGTLGNEIVVADSNTSAT